MSIGGVAFLVLLLRTCATFEEKDFACPYGDVGSTSVCDGTVDCRYPTDSDEIAGREDDESPTLCAPLPYLKKLDLEVSNVTSTSAHLSWSPVPRHVDGHSLALAGYLVTGRSVSHSFQNWILGRLHSHQLEWMKPWTNYTVLVRPFYTESEKPQEEFKLGSATTVMLRTRFSEPGTPALVSVLSAQQRNVVLNIVGPSAWNSGPVGFHIRWEATIERQWTAGQLDVTLSAEWSLEENTINATLPLQGGIDYRLFVSAVGADGTGRTLKSPEAAVKISVPLDSYEIYAYALDPHRALVCWRSSDFVDSFRVMVYVHEGVNILRMQSTQHFKGKDMVTSMYSVVLTNLLDWRYYTVVLEGCSAVNCRDAVNTTFSTPPDKFPAPEIVGVKATGASSFEVTWLLPRQHLRPLDAFRVRYCPKNVFPCVLVYTKDNILTVDGLAPETTVEVQVAAQYRDKNGTLQRGAVATASVTTWSRVPVVNLTYEATIGATTGYGTCLLSWRSVNSSVEYFEYRFWEKEEWRSCNDSTECDITAVSEEDVASASGYITLTDTLVHVGFPLWVRGCNNYGCGEEWYFKHPVHIQGMPPLSGVAVILEEGDAVLRWNDPGPVDYDGIEVIWNCGRDKTVTYEASVEKDRFLPSRHPLEEFGTEALIEGLPTGAEHCEFYAALYKDDGDRRLYSAPVKATKE